MITLSEVVQRDFDERQIHEGQEYDVEFVVARLQVSPAATLRQDVELRVEHRQRVDLAVAARGGEKVFDAFELLFREHHGVTLSRDWDSVNTSYIKE